MPNEEILDRLTIDGVTYDKRSRANILMWYCGDDPLDADWDHVLDFAAQARQDATTLRDALVGLVGEDDPVELAKMEGFLASVPRDDQAATVNAVRVLRLIRPVATPAAAAHTERPQSLFGEVVTDQTGLIQTIHPKGATDHG